MLNVMHLEIEKYKTNALQIFFLHGLKLTLMPEQKF